MAKKNQYIPRREAEFAESQYSKLFIMRWMLIFGFYKLLRGSWKFVQGASWDVTLPLRSNFFISSESQTYSFKPNKDSEIRELSAGVRGNFASVLRASAYQKDSI